ncbi:MAG TPA: isoamylase early set domain-containing protein [Gemmatimonadaceae bacterium]|nr:isoamylase early set domain-containing protein [Gemmatimonadaceae bacterium]
MSDIERDELIERVAREVRRPVAVGPGLDARIMAAVRAERSRATDPAARRAWRWLVRPRTVALSPLAGLAMAAGVAGVMVLLGRGDSRPASPAATTAVLVPAAADVRPAANTPAREVQFVLVAPRARQVAVVGDFNDWDPARTPMRVSASGVWSARLPLALGRHEYAFVVDGAGWTLDPSAPSAPADDFGKPNSVITVGESAP